MLPCTGLSPSPAESSPSITLGVQSHRFYLFISYLAVSKGLVSLVPGEAGHTAPSLLSLTAFCFLYTSILCFLKTVRTHTDKAPWGIVAVLIFLLTHLVY